MNIQRFIDRPILSCVISVFTVLLGIIGLMRLPLEQFPEIAPPTVRITATYQGANASTLMHSVIAPIEEAVNGVEGINYMTSSANNNGQATITVFFRQGTDPDMAAVNVQNRLAQAQGLLPAEVTRAGVNVRKSQNSTAKIVALFSPDNRYDQKFIYNYFKINIEPRLARVPGVGDITLFGSEYSLRIWLKPERMALHGLIPSDIDKVLAEQNIEIATGTLGADGDNTFQYTLNYRGRLSTEDEFRDIVIRSGNDGTILRLGDVADIQLGQLSYSVKNEMSGHPGTNCMIAQAPGSNANEVVRDIDAIIAEAAANLPDGLALVDLMSVKSFMDASISNVFRTLVEAIILVVIVVFVFLQNLRSSLIPAISIIVSLIGTLAVIYFVGFSLNMLTLFALVLVIGTVVDDAIVVVEAVQSQFDIGITSPKTAAYDAMHTVTRPLVTTSLVFMAVFIPVCFIEGTAGIFYRQFGVTMAIAVLISTINALTLSPALAAIMMKPVKIDSKFSRAFQASFNALTNKYISALSSMMRHKTLLFAMIAITAMTFIYLFLNTRSGFVPNEDTGTVVVDVQAAPGSSKTRTEEIMAEIERRIADIPQFQIYSKSIGMGMLGGNGAANGTFIIRLKPWEQRTGEKDDNMSVIEEIYSRLSDIQDARIMSFAQPIIAGYGVTNGFEVHVQDIGDNGTDQLEQHTQEFISALVSRPEIARAQTSFNSRYPQYRIDVDAAMCKRNGVDPDILLQTIGTYIGGQYVSNINRFSKLYRVVLQAPSDDRLDTESLSKIYVRNSNGDMTPAINYLTLTKIYGAESLTRFNLFQSIAVNGAPAQGYSSGQAITAIKEVARQTLPSGYGIEFGGMTREEESTSGNSAWIFILCAVFIYLILAALYENLTIPFAVMLSVPFGMTGSFLFAWIFGIDNNIYMQTGIIMLIGLLAKTAILLTEYATELCHKGYDIKKAATLAAKARIRPILMTSATMIFGLLPMIFATGVGSNGSKSLAFGVIGGMLTGTLAILFIVPCILIILNRSGRKS